jgi:hypothetical protein
MASRYSLTQISDRAGPEDGFAAFFARDVGLEGRGDGFLAPAAAISAHPGQPLAVFVAFWGLLRGLF